LNERKPIKIKYWIGRTTSLKRENPVQKCEENTLLKYAIAGWN
jgi:hypothetical protein